MLVKEFLIRKKDDNNASFFYKDQKKSYSEIYENVIQVEKIIRSTQYKGYNIGIYFPNSLDYIIAYFSVLFAEKVIVPINIRSKEDELKKQIVHCEMGLILTDSSHVELLSNIRLSHSLAFTIIDIVDGQIYHDSKDNAEYTLIDEDVILMLHTSGTTGNQKSVMLTNENLVFNVESHISSLNISSEDKTLIMLPMCFGYCNTTQLLTHIYLGASIVIMDGLFAPRKMLLIIEDESITNFTCVPTILLSLLSYRYINQHNIDSIRFILFGGSMIPLDKLNIIINMFKGADVYNTYGMTECSPRITLKLCNDNCNSVGKAINGVTVKIVDENGFDLTRNQIGEIIISGKNIMKGYFKNVSETKKTIVNGWLYTGDLGYMDEEGNIFLIGRKKNIIISGGINLYPEEIESVLKGNEYVKEAMVVPEEDHLLGEIPIANVVLTMDAQLYDKQKIEIELLARCSEKLSSYKVPKKIVFVEEIKHTTTGKVRRENNYAK